MQKVLGSYILIQEIVADKKESITGLIMSANDTAKMRYQEANVFAIGADVKYVNVDDVIMYDGAQGHSIMVKDVSYRIIQERDVAVVL